MSTHYIYALVDPRDEAIFYVGQTRQPERRLQRHIKTRVKYNDSFSAAMDALRMAGLEPKMMILEKFDPRDYPVGEYLVGHRERFWINKCKNEGQPITNIWGDTARLNFPIEQEPTE